MTPFSESVVMAVGSSAEQSKLSIPSARENDVTDDAACIHMRWHQSGTRRDICILLADAGELRGQRLKTRLESRYDKSLDPKRFYGTLDRLVESGHVEKRVEGLYDVYSLTDVGESALREQFEWMRERVEG